ncbi:hypothetical protein OKW11_001905 [Pseudomonas baetica]|nr:hypothetical protein [Pseudomonas baetica]
MDDLPIGPMLAVVTLLILWSGLFTAIEAAHQHLLAKRIATRSSDKPPAKLSFPLVSLIFCNTLCRALVVVIGTLLAIFTWAENGPWVACLGAGAILLVFFRLLATRARRPLSGCDPGPRQQSAARAAENHLSRGMAAQQHQSVADAAVRP